MNRGSSSRRRALSRLPIDTPHAVRFYPETLSQRILNIVLTTAGLVFLPLFTGSWVWNLSDDERLGFLIGLGVIWGMYIAEFVIGVVSVKGDRFDYLTKNWWLVLIVLFPPMRSIKRLRYLATLYRNNGGQARAFLGFNALLIVTTALIFTAATAIITIEQRSNPEFQSLGDALWWAVVTMTTVGYGDIVPATILGRATAIIVMLFGIALFSAIAGNLSSFVTRSDEATYRERLDEQISELISQVNNLSKEIKSLHGDRSEET